MCAAPATAAALAVLFPIIFNYPFPFFPLTIRVVFLVIDIVTSARIASVCVEDVVVRINYAPVRVCAVLGERHLATECLRLNVTCSGASVRKVCCHTCAAFRA